MARAARLYLFVLTAISTGGDAAPGPKPIIALSRGRTPNLAMKRAAEALWELGWRDIEVQGGKELDDLAEARADPLMADALAKAEEAGFGHITY